MTSSFRACRFIVRNPGESPQEHSSYHESIVDHNGRKVSWSYALQNARAYGGVAFEADAAGNERVVRDFR